MLGTFPHIMALGKHWYYIVHPWITQSNLITTHLMVTSPKGELLRKLYFDEFLIDLGSF